MIFNTFAVTRHNFHFVNFRNLLHLPELDIVQHERPHIVTESVRVQFASLKSESGLYTRCQRHIDRFVEQQQYFTR